VCVRIYSIIYQVIIDVVKTDGITNHNSRYTLSAFRENNHIHYKKYHNYQVIYPFRVTMLQKRGVITMHTQIDNKTKGCKCMSGFIILDVTSIRYVKAPDMKTSHDAHLHNKFRKNFDFSCEGTHH